MTFAEDIVRVEVAGVIATSQQLQGVVQDYLDCQQRVNEWETHFNNACDNLRTLIESGAETVVIIGHTLYLVSHTHEGFLIVDELVRRGDA